MEIKVTLRGDIGALGLAQANNIAKALTQAFRIGGNDLKQRGRAAIAAGGLSSRFANAFRVNVYPKTGISSSPRIFAYHKIKWAGQFQDPEPVQGKPYLWLPITKNLPLQGGGKRWTPADFARTVGPLKGGSKGGKPLLFGQVLVGKSGGVLAIPTQSKSAHGQRVRERFYKVNTKKAWLPVFVGVRSVNDPKRFDLVAVAEKVGSEISDGFSQAFDNG